MEFLLLLNEVELIQGFSPLASDTIGNWKQRAVKGLSHD